MSVRLIHRIIGIVLLLPLLGWAITGAFFFIKPGYDGAYEVLAVKTYPLEGGEVVRPQAGWREARMVRTILGAHCWRTQRRVGETSIRRRFSLRRFLATRRCSGCCMTPSPRIPTATARSSAWSIGP